ncbi:MAG: hypothetical protein ABL308_14395 [Oceanicaulis sp.]
MDDAVMRALKAHLASADHIDVSRYQFVNMDAVRAAAGELWPDVRQRVFLAARSIIERRLAEADLVIQCATGFLVIFKALSGAAADQTTARIREDLERFFLGEKFAELLRVEATSEKLTPAEFEAALAAAGGVDESAPPASPKPPDPGKPAPAALGGLSFLPAWDVRREAAASYFADPRLVTESGAPDAAETAAVLKRPDDRLAFDLAVLERAAAALKSALSHGARCAIIVPAGYAALGFSRTRSSYVTALAALPRDLRQLVWVKLVGAPADAPGAAMAETGRIVLAHTPHLFVQADLKALTLERYLQTGASFIGASFPKKLTEAARSDLDGFLARAGRAGAPVWFDGVDDWDRLRTASKTPAKLLAGAAIGRLDAPAAPYRITRTKLLSKAA